jgi:hypothetical protein
VVACAVGAAAVACSADEGEFAAAAENAIEGDLAENLELGTLSADCAEPESTEDGTPFACTAETADGATVEVRAVIDGDDQVVVNAVNVIPADGLGALEAEAARTLADQVGQPLPAESIDCGAEPIVVRIGEPITCALTHPGSGEVHDATIVFDDYERDSFTVELAQAPRG